MLLLFSLVSVMCDNATSVNSTETTAPDSSHNDALSIFVFAFMGGLPVALFLYCQITCWWMENKERFSKRDRVLVSEV